MVRRCHDNHGASHNCGPFHWKLQESFGFWIPPFKLRLKICLFAWGHGVFSDSKTKQKYIWQFYANNTTKWRWGRASLCFACLRNYRGVHRFVVVVLLRYPRVMELHAFNFYRRIRFHRFCQESSWRLIAADYHISRVITRWLLKPIICQYTSHHLSGWNERAALITLWRTGNAVGNENKGLGLRHLRLSMSRQKNQSRPTDPQFVNSHRVIGINWPYASPTEAIESARAKQIIHWRGGQNFERVIKSHE